MTDFSAFELCPQLHKSLTRMHYKQPTPIQAKAIPVALTGRDIMGSAQTGTGKTAAFAIPVVQQILDTRQGVALIITPTRELGKQIIENIHKLLGPRSNINTAFLIGGASMGRQCAELRRKARIIVGTPGRIEDHLQRRTLKLDNAKFLVLDETDRMLDMGFSVAIDRIVKQMPRERQTLMFSATMPKNIVNLAKKYLKNPERIAVGSTTSPIKSIKQEFVEVKQEDKYEKLAWELEQRRGTIIVFVKTKYATEKLAKKLRSNKFEAEAIHGDLRQSRRDRVIRGFRDQRFRILIATDVIARGLDIPHVEHVINYDLPQAPEDYIHRIGRTARAGATGQALSIYTGADRRKLQAIEILIDPDKKPKREAKPFNKGKRRFNDKRKRSFGNKRERRRA